MAERSMSHDPCAERLSGKLFIKSRTVMELYVVGHGILIGRVSLSPLILYFGKIDFNDASSSMTIHVETLSMVGTT